MNIGTASRKSGLPPKTIRYYEEIGLVTADRRDNGYRDYSDTDVRRLNFLHRARDLGFTVEECRQLLSLYDDEHRESSEVKALAETRLADIERRIAELQSLKRSLHHLVANCHGDDRPDCPIIEGLAGQQI
jgi:MerR family transcriptional regulator, copper efflux regulator